MANNFINAVGITSLLLFTGCGPDPDYGEQFITLPSGAEAYCNRQGYREIRVGPSTRLVTYQNGEFVGCDAKVGPPWDDLRTSTNGRLLSPAQMDQALREREEERQAAHYNSPEAVAARSLRNNQNGHHDYGGAVSRARSRCPEISAAAFEELQNIDPSEDFLNWSEKARLFRAQCSEEEDGIAIIAAEQNLRNNYEEVVNRARSRCPEISAAAFEELKTINLREDFLGWSEETRLFGTRCSAEEARIAIIASEENLRIAAEERDAEELRQAIRNAKELCEDQFSETLQELMATDFETEREMSRAFGVNSDRRNQCRAAADQIMIE